MSTTPGSTSGSGAAPTENVEQHEETVESHEAYQYWGYLFKADKTGTDKLKSLLRGLKELVNAQYEPSDTSDLTPSQLAHFYRDLHGNYDQLFLGTPSESIAFIYKSLGCLHSLQPVPHSSVFVDPTVPSLNTEGWIMWQTIQLLLGPEEHGGFIMEALQKWDVKDPATGEVFPKILPRQCFPTGPDKHMVAWYEGVSERLRREAEDEERRREVEAQQAEVRRIRDGRRDDDEEGSVDSRGPALAYFRDPLYRQMDGRPSIVRRSSKRPQLSPRPNSLVGRGKGGLNTMGHVIRNIGSPHLWDGRGPVKNESRDWDRDRKRRTSLPENRYQYPGGPPTSGSYESNLTPGQEHHHHRKRSTQLDRVATHSTVDHEPSEGDSPGHAPGSDSRHRHHRRDELDPHVRHSRSHEPTPSQKEYPDYFHGYDDPSQRENSADDDDGSGTPPSANGFGPSFGPSASPLFASHVAKQPQPQPRPPPSGGQDPLRKSASVRNAQGPPYSHSRSPAPSFRHHGDQDHHRHSSQDRRSRHDSPRPIYPEDILAKSASPVVPPVQQPGFPPVGPGPGDPNRRPPSGAPSGYMPSVYPPPGQAPSRDRRSAAMSGSDVSGYSGTEDRRPRPKQTRFAAGVDGRKYPNESPWR